MIPDYALLKNQGRPGGRLAGAQMSTVLQQANDGTGGSVGAKTEKAQRRLLGAVLLFATNV
ncbi:MAG: hypothetical protein ABI537_10640 [Casimicrobiaceae bacterium]